VTPINAKKKLALRAALAAPLLLTAGSLAADGPMDCVNEMTMPYALGQIFTSIPATIEVRVTIGRNGRARSVDYGDAKPILKLALDQFFKEEASYLSACEGRTIAFTVRYLIDGAPTPYPLSKIRFRSPNEFVVIAHPMEPSLDPIPKLPPKQPKPQ